MRTGLTAVVAVLALAACGSSDRVELRAVAPSTTTTAALRGDALRYVPRPVSTTRASRSSGIGGRVTVPGRATARQPTTGPARGPGQINGYPCGGDLPYCSVLRRESGGSPTAVNRSGCGGRTCGGLWQFDPVTFIPGCTVKLWNAGKCGSYRGFRFGQDAPAGVQNERAAEVWDHGRGCGHWAACG